MASTIRDVIQVAEVLEVGTEVVVVDVDAVHFVQVEVVYQAALSPRRLTKSGCQKIRLILPILLWNSSTT